MARPSQRGRSHSTEARPTALSYALAWLGGPAQTVVNVGNYQTSNMAARLAVHALPLSRERPMRRWFGTPVYSVVAATLPTKVPVVYRPGVCQHLHFIGGRCAAAQGHIATTARTPCRRCEPQGEDYTLVSRVGSVELPPTTWGGSLRALCFKCAASRRGYSHTIPSWHPPTGRGG